ncbi:MAG: MGH1-like glycoside hydrolase domain-containing protein, partial [Nitrospiraceae bacterium]
KDPILKERLFGLTNSEGNHGEDVKEYYFYLDSTPTHSYMKYLYKYPQVAYPYGDLVETNKRRSKEEAEYELLDTGVFNDDRYCDVFVEYAKDSPNDVCIQITVCNRGKEATSLHLLPTLWFRNTWSWAGGGSKPALRSVEGGKHSVIHAVHTDPLFKESLEDYYLYCEGPVPLLFTENETNHSRLFGTENRSPYVKDGINNYIVQGQKDAVNPKAAGTKASPHYQLTVGPGATQVVRLRLTGKAPSELRDPFGKFDVVVAARQKDADEFYDAITPPAVKADPDRARIMRQALAGMLWSKQYYYFDADQWLDEHHSHPLNRRDQQGSRNREWFHMVNDDIISMPDKWEYPWYAAWDLAFHTSAFTSVDLDFAKQQINLMLSQHYLHPNGQIPAYEWNFSDVNPPVHAWATLFLHRLGTVGREPDFAFLKSAFARLSLNFTWWVNRKDRFGKNLFEGGFLGLDNIGVFDRSAPLPTGGHLEQADGTAWMALFSQNMAELAVELAAHDPDYDEMAAKYSEHFLWIAAAMNQPGADGMWDEEDGFYYDILRLPDGTATRLKVRSMVGLLPLCATSVIEPWQRETVPKSAKAYRERIQKMPELFNSIHPTGPGHQGVGERGIFALVNQERLRRILTKMLDENEFLSPYGIRSLSKFHEQHPFIFHVGSQEHRVDYLPGESNSGMFGGNSNWRGPIWMPVNALIIRALLMFYAYYGDNFKIECPTGSGRMMNLFEVAKEIVERLARIFLQNSSGRRPLYGGADKFQEDPHWRDYLLFYEYFHGDTGAGLGASHQTGWTGLVAKLIQIFGAIDPKQFLESGVKGFIKAQADRAGGEAPPAGQRSLPRKKKAS